ncbi:hypothetical protein AAG570_006344 [Ranatra chinensis]|uniref:Uncharacterized protein n=1 Tax=Ranatra chinensis TaxID=642074 RepID=A0ABD0YU09_9HEMI
MGRGGHQLTGLVGGAAPGGSTSASPPPATSPRTPPTHPHSAARQPRSPLSKAPGFSRLLVPAWFTSPPAVEFDSRPNSQGRDVGSANAPLSPPFSVPLAALFSDPSQSSLD